MSTYNTAYNRGSGEREMKKEREVKLEVEVKRVDRERE
jgi:hypothetical protein